VLMVIELVWAKTQTCLVKKIHLAWLMW
jgi:hypothetical protein